MRFFRLRFLLHRQLDRFFIDAHAVIVLLEDDTAFKILAAAQAAEISAEGFVFQLPLRSPQSPFAADRTDKVHLLLIHLGVLQIADIIVFEGDPLKEPIVALIRAGVEQLLVVQLLEAQGRQLRVILGTVQRGIVKADAQPLSAGGKPQLTAFFVIIKRSLTVLLQIDIFFQKGEFAVSEIIQIILHEN